MYLETTQWIYTFREKRYNILAMQNRFSERLILCILVLQAKKNIDIAPWL